MKVLSISLLVCVLFVFGCSCEQASEKHTQKVGLPLMEFKKDLFDFGTCISGEKVRIDFYFKNKGDAPLLLKDVYASCGCTVVKFSKEPLEMGGEGRINIIFDSAGRRGLQYKSITVVSNAARKKTLYIKGNVNTN